jgi:hypothetical protein
MLLAHALWFSAGEINNLGITKAVFCIVNGFTACCGFYITLPTSLP